MKNVKLFIIPALLLSFFVFFNGSVAATTIITATKIVGPTPPPVQIDANTNTIFTFWGQSSSQNQTLIYKINWGDGFATQHTVADGTYLDLIHQWSGSRTYTITFTATLASDSSSSGVSYMDIQINEQRTGPAITVLVPNGGEKWIIGQEARVTWRRNWMPAGANGLVDIYYNTGGLNTFLAGGVNDSYGFTWIVPAWLTAGSNYKVVVTSHGSGGSLTAPLSDEGDTVFSVVKPTASIYNLTNDLRNPTFWTGDSVRLAINNLPANQARTIKSCYSYQGSTGCDSLLASIDSNGTWRQEFQVLGISLGDWQRWISIDGIESNRVFYSVINAPAPTPTPIPTSTPRPTSTPTPIPSITPTPTSVPTFTPTIDQGRIYSLAEIFDGDLIRGQGDIAVWIVKIVGEKRYKRWLFGPQIFDAYGHLGFNKVKNISKVTLNNFDTSNLIRKFDEAKVYELTDFVPGVRAIRRWVPTVEIFLQRGFDFDSVYIVNQREFDLYPEGASL